MVRVAVVGAGAWGINHVRAMARTPGAKLVMVCDSSAEARARVTKIVSGVQLGRDFAEAISAEEVDAVIIATPAKEHAKQARQALLAGKHVLVEKPMALALDDARTVVEAAEVHHRVLMVGHLMLYHPVVQHLKSLMDHGELGKILYLYSVRVNLGKVRPDENALWSLAPHDVSMMEYLLGEVPVTVSARGGAYLQPNIEDVVFVNLQFHSGITAQIQVSWLDPRKERRLTIVGSKKMVEFDDVSSTEKLKIYNKGVERPATFTEYAQFLSIRNGDIYLPHVPMSEPLEQECAHFIECISQGKTPRTNGNSAMRVVEVLEAAQRSLSSNGAPIQLHSTVSSPASLPCY